MRWLKHPMIVNLLTAFVLYEGLALALGWHCFLTPIGRDGWPLPTPESAASIMLERFSPDGLPISLKSPWWFVVVPCVGLAWVSLLYVTAAFFGQPKCGYTEVLRRFALGNAPLGVCGLLLTAASWKWDWGYWWSGRPWEAWRNIALGMSPWPEHHAPWPWLGPAMMAVGGVVLGIQCAAYCQCFGISGSRIAGHLAISSGLLAAVAAGAGPILSEFVTLIS